MLFLDNSFADSLVTSLSLSWIQPGSPVDNYTVSYTYTIRQCGPEQTPISGEMSITGNTSSVTLDNLEEDSNYSIIITASIGAIQVDSTVLTATTAMSGSNYIPYRNLIWH